MIRTAVDKAQVCSSIHIDVYHKLEVLYTVRKRCLKDGTTRSDIINAALDDYFINHKEEIDQIMDQYHKQGGLLEL